MCQLAAEVTGYSPGEFLPSSTGIIGHMLPMSKLERGIVEAGHALGSSRDHALLFADAILTTDLKRKSAGVRFKIGRQVVTLAGVCKGSGMIGPRMSVDTPADLRPSVAAKRSASTGPRTGRRRPLHATMLAYLTTDASISPVLLRRLMQQATDTSFNAVTVDDHTSTNDTAVLMASGLSGAKVSVGASLKSFTQALAEVSQSLAYQIAADGEGATKVVKIEVRGCAKVEHARAIARAIANSPLVKCAMHGNDPNWGRIVSAAGLAGVPFDPERATLLLQGTPVFRSGRPVPFDAGKVSATLAAPEVLVKLDCRLGDQSTTVWTCDFSKEYVTINADYHT